MADQTWVKINEERRRWMGGWSCDRSRHTKMDVNKREGKDRAMRGETMQRGWMMVRDGRQEGWIGGCL